VNNFNLRNVLMDDGITPPNGVTSIGATAEWIVEGISPILPVFSTVVFTNCSAGTKNHSFKMNGGTISLKPMRINLINGIKGSRFFWRRLKALSLA
jgi:hypothetical protein